MRVDYPRGPRHSGVRNGRALPHLRSAFRSGLFLAALPLGGCGQEGPPRQPDPRIAAAESGLTTPLRIRDREPERYTVQDRMEHYRVPGVSLAVLEEGRIAWVGTYGVADAGTLEPVTPETLFQAASISKPLAALAALRLVEEGILELDAPVNRYLQGWQLPDNAFTAGRPVTLRHLLTHTGGLTVHGFPGYAVDNNLPSVVDLLDGGPLSNTPPVRVDTLPGSLWRYSGGGYTILQKLLEDVTRKPFPVLLRELVLDPAAMTLSSYEQPLPPERERYAASGHLSAGDPVEGRWHLYPEMAAAGLWTNATELARLGLEVQAAWRGEPGRILSPEMARAMLTPGMGGWGLGFSILEEGAPRFVHGGSNHGFKAEFIAFREDGRGVVVMTNGDQGTRLAQEIVQAVAETYGWPVPGPREVELAALPPELLARVAGPYRVDLPDRTVEVTVEVEGDHLRIHSAEGAPGDEFFPLSETRFIDLSTGEEIEAVLDDAGRVVELALARGLRARRVEG
jgi:CubicO group peptidase (beta-lactamase class C family)